MYDFAVTPPWYQDDVETTAFNLFCMEESKSQKIEEFINLLSQAEDPNDSGVQTLYYFASGLDKETELTLSEKEYIEREVANRWMY